VYIIAELSTGCGLTRGLGRVGCGWDFRFSVFIGCVGRLCQKHLWELH